MQYFFDSDATSAKALCQRAKLPVRRWKPNEGPSELARCVDVRNPADILNYGGIKYYSVYWVRTRGRVVAGSKYYLNKNNNKNKT